MSLGKISKWKTDSSLVQDPDFFSFSLEKGLELQVNEFEEMVIDDPSAKKIFDQNEYEENSELKDDQNVSQGNEPLEAEQHTDNANTGEIESQQEAVVSGDSEVQEIVSDDDLVIDQNSAVEPEAPQEPTFSGEEPLLRRRFCPNSPPGSFGTEPGTGNRTILEPEPAEPAIKNELDEPEPIFGSLKFPDCFVL